MRRLGLERRLTGRSRKAEQLNTHDFFGLNIAVEMSFGPGWGGAPLGSAIVRDRDESMQRLEKQQTGVLNVCCQRRASLSEDKQHVPRRSLPVPSPTFETRQVRTELSCDTRTPYAHIGDNR
jgi:hypothetical protein